MQIMKILPRSCITAFFWIGFIVLTCACQKTGLSDFAMMRKDMVRTQIEARGVTNPLVLKAMHEVERHLFVPSDAQKHAYDDYPLPIGHDQTISQPYIVALMTELINPQKEYRILEIGTGSGYQSAVLSTLVKQVYTIEIIPPLAEESRALLKKLGYDNIEVLCGNGYLGWPEQAPFDAIIVTAAPEEIPPALIEQLKIGGKLIIPVGRLFQDLKVVTKTESGVTQKSIIPVRFVPMVGKGEVDNKQ